MPVFVPQFLCLCVYMSVGDYVHINVSVIFLFMEDWLIALRRNTERKYMLLGQQEMFQAVRVLGASWEKKTIEVQ